MAKEEIILDLSVDQGSMISELERTKKSIIELKKEQQDLTKAYKAGTVTLDEYASESVRLEAILKKEQATYNNTQKSLTGVKTKMDDLIASNNKLATSVKTSTENIRIAGVSVGDLTTKIASFANPATAAVAVVSALGAAYARSSIGAKDLEFAQNQLNFILDSATDKFASIFSSVEDGEGILTKYLNAYLKVGNYTPVGQALKLFGVDLSAIAEESKEAAQAVEDLNNVRDAFALRQATITERLSENADLVADLANTETKSNDRLKIAQQIRENINKNTQELLVFKAAEIEAENKLLKIRKDAGGDTDDIELRISKLTQELTAISLAESRQIARIDKQINSINKAESQRLEIEKKKTSELKKQEDVRQSEIDRNKRIRDLDASLAGTGDVSGVEDPFGTEDFKNKEVKLSDDTLDILKTNEKKKRSLIKETTEFEKEQLQDRIEFATTLLSQSATLFEKNTVAYKLLATTDAIVNTYKAANLALGSYPPPASFALAAISIATGLANVAKIQGVAAAGGADFVTNKPTMLLVGDNPGGRERVTVEPLSGRGTTRTFNGGVAMAGGGSMTFDPASAAATQNVNQALATSNAIKRMPRPVVGVKEIARVMEAVEVKQNVSKQ